MVYAGGPDRITRIASRIASCSAVFLLAILGMLITPVSCTCGAQIPHGHSLFQLPHHYHGNHAEPQDDAAYHEEHETDARADEKSLRSNYSGYLVVSDVDECDKGGRNAWHVSGFTFALDNLLEQGDGPTVSTPPASSFGQPIAFAPSPQVSLPVCDSRSVNLPTPRELNGTVTTPDTPPPQVLV